MSAAEGMRAVAAGSSFTSSSPSDYSIDEDECAASGCVPYQDIVFEFAV
jgi:hypothetical protein